ncbi:MAG: D-alanyl-D-alanine carboxypeptidase [Deltaproteobacteria bacterium]|nr:MAG: D-alanyl-D-alanine carboxypeptidase [Deltaproteobacteria bacterium]
MIYNKPEQKPQHTILGMDPTKSLAYFMAKFRKHLAIFLWIIPIISGPLSYSAKAQGLQACLHWITESDSIILADAQGNILIRKHDRKERIPASTLKLLTALVALREMGPAYRFKTTCYLTGQGNLLIKGYGDPLLISEVLNDMAQVLAGRIHRIKDIIVDNHYFSRSITIPGRGHSTNPYDAPPAALCANFNTINVTRDRYGNIISAEPQTPLTPLGERIAKTVGARNGRYTLGDDPDVASRYAGEILAHFLREKGVAVTGSVRLGTLSPAMRPLLTYRSPFTLREVIQKMLEFSSNFMANQLVISMGAIRYGPPGTVEKGLRIVRGYANRELGLNNIWVVEGSGISRDNRISAKDMLTVLMHFRPYHHLLRKKTNLFYKTGTLKDVRTCVGYIKVLPMDLYPFVIFVNRPFHQMDHIITCLLKATIRKKKGL